MNQDRLAQILELESNYQKLTEVGNPNVVDNGFFVDAVFNVTERLKKDCQLSDECTAEDLESIRIISDLYKSLQEFQNLYHRCLDKKE